MDAHGCTMYDFASLACDVMWVSKSRALQMDVKASLERSYCHGKLIESLYTVGPSCLTVSMNDGVSKTLAFKIVCALAPAPDVATCVAGACGTRARYRSAQPHGQAFWENSLESLSMSVKSL